MVRKFEELEIEASALEALEAQMRDAVEIEDYNNAAALKRAVDGVARDGRHGSRVRRVRDGDRGESIRRRESFA